MTLILEPIEDNIKWFASTVINEYLFKSDQEPNYKNLKWMLGSYCENKEYDTELLDQMFMSTVEDIYDLFDTQITNMDLSLKNYYLETLAFNLKKLFIFKQDIIMPSNQLIINKILSTLKYNDNELFFDLLTEPFIFTDKHYSFTPEIVFCLISNVTEVIKSYKTSDIYNFNCLMEKITEILAPLTNQSYNEKNIEKLKKKYKVFNDLSDEEISQLCEIFYDGYITPDIEILQNKMVHIEELINSLEYNHDLTERKWKSFHNIIYHYVANYLISYIDFKVQENGQFITV